MDGRILVDLVKDNRTTGFFERSLMSSVSAKFQIPWASLDGHQLAEFVYLIEPSPQSAILHIPISAKNSATLIGNEFTLS